MARRIDKLRKQLTAPNLIRRFLVSWLFAVLIEYCILPAELLDLATVEGLAQMSLVRIICITGLVAALLSALSVYVETRIFERWSLLFVFGALAVVACLSSAASGLLITSILILVVLVIWVFCGWDTRPEPNALNTTTSKAYLWIAFGLAAVFFLFVSVWTVGRIYSLRAPCYDFGIFSQMFYYMKETGLPMTTVERDGLLSHFAVHVSPIYYLLLPIYWLFPKPATLQILQALVLASSVFPLWQLGKQYGLNGLQRMLVCGVLFVYPAYSGGTSYDIHENCFLTPLLLWLFYGISRRNVPMISIAAILTLAVKEDAAVYVAVISLWLILKTLLQPKVRNVQDLLTGILLLVVSFGWFFCVTGYLANNGDGVMTNRYENYMYDGSSSLVTVIKAVLLNPMKALYECGDPDKLRFIALTMLPLLGIPLLTRRYERYILLIPYILVNLMSDYPYQHDIFFQYTFGPIACLMYLTIVNLADLKRNKLQTCSLLAAISIGAACFATTVFPKAFQYPAQAILKFDYFQGIRDKLDMIPEDASVSATSYYTTYLSQRKVLYDIQYCSKEHVLYTEYIVLDPNALSEYSQYETAGAGNGFDNFISILEESGYSKIISIDNTLVVYCMDSSITNTD